jgi:hypothetical protein
VDPRERRRRVTSYDGTWPMRPENNAKCPECGRVFNLLFGDDANEWYYGHDCEGGEQE